MKQKNEKEFKKFIMERAMNIAEVDAEKELPSTDIPDMPKDNRDVTNFEERFDKIKTTVQSIFNAINNQKEFEDVLSYMIDEFKYVTDSAKITAIRKVLADKSKPDTQKV
jgi:hypothetical protein